MINMRAILAAVAGLAFAFFVAATVTFVITQQRRARAGAGYHLVPTLVFASDVAAGEVVTFDVLSQRLVPEKFVTASVAKPESQSHVVNTRTIFPAQAGDPVLWSALEPTRFPVWVAARDLPEGTALERTDAEPRLFTRAMITRSFVGKDEVELLVGVKLRVALRAGDPILWTQLDSPPTWRDEE